MRNVVIGTLAVAAVASMAGNVLLYKRYSSSRPLVRVGNEVITKKDYQDALDQQTQGAILKKMVFEKLTMQAAAKDGVVPTEKDIDSRIAFIQRTKPETLQAAEQSPGGMPQFRDGLKAQMALENLRTEGIKVSDAEVNTFYTRNKAVFALPRQMQTTAVVTGNSVDASTAASLLRQNTPTDIIGRQPRLHVVGLNGFHPDFQAMPTAIRQKMSQVASAMKPGDVEVVPMGANFITLKAGKTDTGGVPPLGQVKDQVIEMVKLQKAPSSGDEMIKIYHNANIGFEVDKYAAFFSDIQNATPAPNRLSETASIK